MYRAKCFPTSVAQHSNSRLRLRDNHCPCRFPYGLSITLNHSRSLSFTHSHSLSLPLSLTLSQDRANQRLHLKLTVLSQHLAGAWIVSFNLVKTGQTRPYPGLISSPCICPCASREASHSARKTTKVGFRLWQLRAGCASAGFATSASAFFSSSDFLSKTLPGACSRCRPASGPCRHSQKRACRHCSSHICWVHGNLPPSPENRFTSAFPLGEEQTLRVMFEADSSTSGILRQRALHIQHLRYSKL